MNRTARPTPSILPEQVPDVPERGDLVLPQDATPQRPFVRRMMTIVWPAFLMAGVLEMLTFAVVDPDSLHWLDGNDLGWSAGTVYAVTFFIYWGVIATAGAMTQLLSEPPHDMNF